jgi:hypothetical protein
VTREEAIKTLARRRLWLQRRVEKFEGPPDGPGSGWIKAEIAALGVALELFERDDEPGRSA